MKKKILIVSLLALGLCGCASQKYGLVKDFDEVNATSEDYHVVFVMGENGCYSDGSYEANQLYNDWVAEYESRH